MEIFVSLAGKTSVSNSEKIKIRGQQERRDSI